MMDTWWNEAIEQQAIDRVHRLGQNKPVYVTRYVIKGTVEKRILKIRKPFFIPSRKGEDANLLQKDQRQHWLMLRWLVVVDRKIKVLRWQILRRYLDWMRMIVRMRDCEDKIGLHWPHRGSEACKLSVLARKDPSSTENRL